MSKRESVMIVGAMCAALLACGKGSSGGTKASGPAISVSAVDLHNEYSANEVAADDRYKGKKLQVSGMIHSIDKDAFDNIIVRLATNNQFQSAMATMEDNQKSAAAQLSKNQNVVVECKGGGLIIGSPVLRDCTLVSNTPASTPAPKKK